MIHLTGKVTSHSALWAPENVRSAAQKKKKETIIAHTNILAHSLRTEAFNVMTGKIQVTDSSPTYLLCRVRLWKSRNTVSVKHYAEHYDLRVCT
jgi:hypothetical protein